MIRSRSSIPRAAMAALALAACGAFSQPLPDPDSVSLERLGLMQGFPPAPDKVVDDSNRTKYPQLRWTLQHTRELLPTRNIRRGSAPVTALPAAPLPIGSVEFQDDKGRTLTVDGWLRETYTDAFVVMHRGRLVFERYLNGARPETPHLLFSVTKSFTGLLAAQLVQEGRLDPEAPVVRYVPELEGSAWGDMKVRHVLDMTGTVRYREVYTDPTTEVFPYLYASRMLPAPPGYAGPRDIYTFLRTLQKGDGEHGDGFVYRTVHSEVLGWIVSRVTNQHFADLLSERIWSKLGMEEDAYVMVDRTGTPLQGAGLAATARDLARFGEMLRRKGEFQGQRILDAAAIADTTRGGDREKFKASGMAFRPGYSYHNQWWVLHNADGAYEASGVHGQLVHVNPAAEMVVVKLSSHPVAAAALTHPLTLRAWEALARAVRNQPPKQP